MDVFDPEIDAMAGSILPDLALLRGSDAPESDILCGAAACRHFIDVPIRVFHPRLGTPIQLIVKRLHRSHRSLLSWCVVPGRAAQRNK
jgi:hypothetical protein